MTRSRLFLLLLFLLFFGQIVYYYPQLPERMATHFNGLGEPDGWASKQGFFVFEVVILLIIIAEFTLVPLLVKHLPNSLINLPNKEYWLADERREQTILKFRTWFEWFGVGLLALLTAVNQLVIQANLTQQNLPSTPMWTIIGAFFLFTTVWLIGLVRQFRIPK